MAVPKARSGDINVWTRTYNAFIEFEVSDWLDASDVLYLKGSIMQRFNSGDCQVELCWRMTNEPTDPSSWTAWAKLPGTSTLNDGSAPNYPNAWTAASVGAYRFFQLGVRAQNTTTNNTATEMCQVRYTFEFRSF